MRLTNAFAETERCKEFDYVIINDELKKAAVNLQSVISAERLRREKQTETIENILKTFENFKTNSTCRARRAFGKTRPVPSAFSFCRRRFKFCANG